LFSAYFQRHVNVQIDQFKTTIKQDQDLLASTLPTPQRKVMIAARMHRKMILWHNFRLATKLAHANGGKAPPPPSQEGGDEL